MRSPLVRKLGLLPRQLPRAKRRLAASADDYRRMPPVLVNSFPKSGTHLLLQILGALPGTMHYGSFIATTPTITFTERSLSAHRRLVGRIAPGELVPAHLYHRREHEELLARKSCVHYFIYRDPRDVVVSEAFYLTSMNRWHRLHRYFSRLESDEARLTFSILGNAAQATPYDYPDVARRFERYRGWLECRDVHALTFEDLVSERREQAVRQAILFWVDRVPGATLDGLVEAALSRIDAGGSHTFREGRIGAWKHAFTERNKEQMKEVAGQLLIDLGYESGLDW